MPSDDTPAEQLPFLDEFGVGETVSGKYLIGPIIGTGGLSLVVSAKHLELEQPVAIKCLRPEFLEDAPTVERFLREGRLATKIKSEHVVRVYDVGRTRRGVPYIVMEYLEGIDLARKASQGPLAEADVVDFVLQACEALAEAHVLGIVHRDLKPENLFLVKRPAGSATLKVLDFGISKYGGPPGKPSAIRTTTGALVGTPVYMSPEQLRSSAQLDARSDIWALGVLMYELLARRFPFDAETLPQLCTQILGEPPAPLGDTVSPALEAIIKRCLAKEPADRFRNVGELAGELAVLAPPRSERHVERILDVVREAGLSVRPAQVTPKPMVTTGGAGSESRASGPWMRGARGGALALLVALGGVGVGVLLMRSQRAPADETRSSTPVSTATRDEASSAAASAAASAEHRPEAPAPTQAVAVAPGEPSDKPRPSAPPALLAPRRNAKASPDAGTSAASAAPSRSAESQPAPSASAPKRERVYRTQFD